MKRVALLFHWLVDRADRHPFKLAAAAILTVVLDFGIALGADLRAIGGIALAGVLLIALD
jgi:hypothetical protein